MLYAAVNDGLNVQSGVNPTALLCAPTFAKVKPLEIAKNTWNWGNKEASTPNSLNAAVNNNGKLTYKIKEIGKTLRIIMSHRSSAAWKTILFPNTSLSLTTLYRNCGRRGP